MRRAQVCDVTAFHPGFAPLHSQSTRVPSFSADLASRTDSMGLSSSCGGEVAEAEQGAGQVEESLEQIRPPLVAHAEATKPEQPGEAALDHPAVPPQTLRRV